MSTELNSLADQTFAISSSAYDNTVNLDMYCDIQVIMSSPTNWGQDFASSGGRTGVMLTCMEAVDGTNFPTAAGFDAVRSSRLMLNYMVMFGVNGLILYGTARQALIPPAKFNIGFFNYMGCPLAASGNLVQMITYGWNTRA